MEDLFNNLIQYAEAYGPRILIAFLIIIVTILVARIARAILARGIDKTGLGKRANSVAEPGQKTLGYNLGTAAYWIVMLIGLVQALTVLGMNTVVDPLNNMLDDILGYLPRVIGAALVFGIFMIVATVVRQASKSVLVFADPLPAKFNLSEGNVNLSGIVSAIVYGLIALIGTIAALEVLDIAAISEPAMALLHDIVGAIPNILIAGIILTLFVMIARFVSDLARKTLPGFGIDEAVAELGILKGADRGMNATGLIASAASFFIILLGLIQALGALQFEPLSEALNVVLEMGAQIAFGVLIIFAGVFLARMITGLMASAGSGATDLAASLVKWVIIGLAIILGISRMGLDPTGGEFILNVAQYLVIGAAAAGAIAFGWGGRDWAAAQLEKFRASR
ncbi:MAG: mechanosensitive ion channel [Pseudomonadota bacterium]